MFLLLESSIELVKFIFRRFSFMDKVMALPNMKPNASLMLAWCLMAFNGGRAYIYFKYMVNQTEHLKV